jgi:uncharacterized protein (DUF736 family)
LARLLELGPDLGKSDAPAESAAHAGSDASRNETGRHHMPAIGYVNRLDDGSYRGTLRTLSISAALKIMPNKEKKPDSDQPDYRVYANGAEIGGAWIRKNKDTGADYVSVSISAPEFGPRRLFANLGRAAGSESDDEFAVIWNPTE